VESEAVEPEAGELATGDAETAESPVESSTEESDTGVLQVRSANVFGAAYSFKFDFDMRKILPKRPRFWQSIRYR
jgi:hypothetical protein